MESGYLNIPNGLKVNPNFTSDEKLILSEIISLIKLKDGCRASDNHFARIINKSRTTTNGIIKSLEQKGFLVIQVFKGKGKVTKLAENFDKLIQRPVLKTDTLPVKKLNYLSDQNQLDGVGNSDMKCRDLIEKGVEIQQDTCRELDTINTIINTDKLIHKLLQYTGATDQNLVEGLNIKGQTYLNRIQELFQLDPETITNIHLVNYYDSLAGLVIQFGDKFLSSGNLLKSNKELYELYGFENFREIRQDLNYVRDNMDYFLRLKTFE